MVHVGRAAPPTPRVQPGRPAGAGGTDGRLSGRSARHRRPSTAVAFRRGSAADYAAVLKLLALAFGQTRPDRFAANHLLDPRFRHRDALLALSDGQPVSHLVVHRWRLRLLGGPAGGVPFGGIGEVATRPEQRRRGYSSELLRRSIGLMAGLRLPLSALGTPIPEFYARLGWEQIARPDYRLSFAPASPPGAYPLSSAAEYAVRPFRDDDLDACVALYERFCARRPRTIVRTRDYWRGQLQKTGLVRSAFEVPSSVALVAVGRRSGAVEAYLRLREFGPWGGEGIGVDEACYREPYAMRALWPHVLATAVEAAGEGRPATIAARLPDDHELSGLLLTAGGERQIEGGQMFRLNDLRRLFAHLRQPIERRLRQAASPRLRLLIAAPYRWLPDGPGGGEALLTWDGESLTVAAADGAAEPDAVRCRFDSTAWLRLLLGESAVASLLAEYDCSAEVARFLGDAFPADWLAPVYWRTDSF